MSSESRQVAISGFRNRQTTSDDLRCLDTDGDCRSCGCDVPDGVLRVVGDNDDRVDACANCYITAGRPVETPVEAAQRAHRDPTWPRDLGGGR